MSASFRPQPDFNSPHASSWGFSKVEATVIPILHLGCFCACSFRKPEEKAGPYLKHGTGRLRESFCEPQGWCSMVGSWMLAGGSISGVWFAWYHGSRSWWGKGICAVLSTSKELGRYCLAHYNSLTSSAHSCWLNSIYEKKPQHKPDRTKPHSKTQEAVYL